MPESNDPAEKPRRTIGPKVSLPGSGGGERPPKKRREPIPEATSAVYVRLTPWVGAALVIIVLAVLWAGAEAHDNNCYTKATSRAASAIASGQPVTQSSCLILPWNKP